MDWFDLLPIRTYADDLYAQDEPTRLPTPTPVIEKEKYIKIDKGIHNYFNVIYIIRSESKSKW